jgi:hypothetical protein
MNDHLKVRAKVSKKFDFGLEIQASPIAFRITFFNHCQDARQFAANESGTTVDHQKQTKTELSLDNLRCLFGVFALRLNCRPDSLPIQKIIQVQLGGSLVPLQICYQSQTTKCFAL